MKILALDTIGSANHVEFNKRICASLEKHAVVTLASVATGRQTRRRRGAGVVDRLSRIRAVRHLLRKSNYKTYDAVIFLAYDALTLSILRPQHQNVLLFEHNNIDAAERTPFHASIYTALPRANHVAFEPYIAAYAASRYRKAVLVVPHPLPSSVPSLPSIVGDCEKRPRRIFSPSGSTPEAVQLALVEAVNTGRDGTTLVAKSSAMMTSDNVRCAPYFEDYYSELMACSIVFVGAQFKYRVSGVAYEALAFGKGLVLLDSLFARELQKKFPHQVKVVNRPREVPLVDFECNGLRNDFKAVLEQHSTERIGKALVQALSNDA